MSVTQTISPVEAIAPTSRKLAVARLSIKMHLARNDSVIRSNGGTSLVTQTAWAGFTNELTVIQSGNNSATATQSTGIAGGNNTSTID